MSVHKKQMHARKKQQHGAVTNQNSAMRSHYWWKWVPVLIWWLFQRKKQIFFKTHFVMWEIHVSFLLFPSWGPRRCTPL